MFLRTKSLSCFLIFYFTYVSLTIYLSQRIGNELLLKWLILFLRALRCRKGNSKKTIQISMCEDAKINVYDYTEIISESGLPPWEERTRLMAKEKSTTGIMYSYLLIMYRAGQPPYHVLMMLKYYIHGKRKKNIFSRKWKMAGNRHLTLLSHIHRLNANNVNITTYPLELEIAFRIRGSTTFYTELSIETRWRWRWKRARHFRAADYGKLMDQTFSWFERDGKEKLANYFLFNYHLHKNTHAQKVNSLYRSYVLMQFKRIFQAFAAIAIN